MPSKKTTTSSTDALLQELRRFGLAYPGAHTKSPWPGHLDLAVKDKTFAYLSIAGQPFSISCKLPQSGLAALDLPSAKPTGYGLGKSGWVTVEAPDGQAPPLAMLKAWVEESYRAQAPKKLVAELDARGAGGEGGGKASASGAQKPARARSSGVKPGASTRAASKGARARSSKPAPARPASKPPRKR